MLKSEITHEYYPQTVVNYRCSNVRQCERVRLYFRLLPAKCTLIIRGTGEVRRLIRPR